MKRAEIQTKIELYRRELKMLEAIKISCANCIFSRNSKWCDKFNAEPPAEVWAAGCDEYEYDEIPF